MFFVEGRSDQIDTVAGPVGRVVEVLREKDVDRGRIGVEWGHVEMQFAQEIQQLLPNSVLVNAEPVLWERRMIKSEEEMLRIRRASDITGDVVDSVYRSSAYESMNEWGFEQCLDVAFAERGSRHLWTD